MYTRQQILEKLAARSDTRNVLHTFRKLLKKSPEQKGGLSDVVNVEEAKKILDSLGIDGASIGLGPNFTKPELRNFVDKLRSSKAERELVEAKLLGDVAMKRQDAINKGVKGVAPIDSLRGKQTALNYSHGASFQREQKATKLPESAKNNLVSHSRKVTNLENQLRHMDAMPEIRRRMAEIDKLKRKADLETGVSKAMFEGVANKKEEELYSFIKSKSLPSEVGQYVAAYRNRTNAAREYTKARQTPSIDTVNRKRINVMLNAPNNLDHTVLSASPSSLQSAVNKHKEEGELQQQVGRTLSRLSGDRANVRKLRGNTAEIKAGDSIYDREMEVKRLGTKLSDQKVTLDSAAETYKKQQEAIERVRKAVEEFEQMGKQVKDYGNKFGGTSSNTSVSSGGGYNPPTTVATKKEPKKSAVDKYMWPALGIGTGLAAGYGIKKLMEESKTPSA